MDTDADDLVDGHAAHEAAHSLEAASIVAHPGGFTGAMYSASGAFVVAPTSRVELSSTVVHATAARARVHLSASSVTAEFVPPASARDAPVAPGSATEVERGASLTTAPLTTPIDADYFAPCSNVAAQWLEHSNGLHNRTIGGLARADNVAQDVAVLARPEPGEALASTTASGRLTPAELEFRRRHRGSFELLLHRAVTPDGPNESLLGVPFAPSTIVAGAARSASPSVAAARVLARSQVAFAGHTPPTIAEVAVLYSLNELQHRAFTLAALELFRHMLRDRSLALPANASRARREALDDARKRINVHFQHAGDEGLRMALQGQGGTGKTEVVKAIMYFAERWGIASHVALTASTGSAAINIGGDTVHSYVGISGVKRDREQENLPPNIAQRIRSTWLLVIDEISMLPADVLGKTLLRYDKVGKAVRQLASFLILGDFYQCECVGVGVHKISAKIDSAHALRGIDFWRNQINCVILLTENWRSKGDPTFQSILTAMRNGYNGPPNSLTPAQLALLNSRVVGTETDSGVPLTVPRSANVVSATNKVRRALVVYDFAREMLQRQSIAAAVTPHISADAQRYGIALRAHLCGASDADIARVFLTLQSRDVTDQSTLNTPHWKLQGRWPTLRLYVGQEVSFTSNLCVSNGSVGNGTRGTVVGFAFHPGTTFTLVRERCVVSPTPSAAATSADPQPPIKLDYPLLVPTPPRIAGQDPLTPIIAVFVKVPDASFPSFSGLPSNVYPVLYPPKTVAAGCADRPIRLNVRYGSRPPFTVIFRQLPIEPACATTIHKSQGRTFDNVYIADFTRRIGILYTAISRSRSLTGIFLPRTLLAKDIIACRLTGDLLDNHKRLEVKAAACRKRDGLLSVAEARSSTNAIS